MKKNAAITIKNLSAGYNHEHIIENINCTIHTKDFFGIIGPNGGGKSTLLKVILGLLPARIGSVTIYGQSPKQARKHIGYVPQYTQYDTHYPITVWEVVLMGRRSSRGLKPRYNQEDKQATQQALEKVDMLSYKDQHINNLSGGQRQRVYIARALVSNPKILLLDEPTANIDKTVQTHFYELLKDLNKDITIVLVTHDIGIISSHVNRVACLNHYLYTHDDNTITEEMLEAAYNCPVDLIAHGVPHRVLPRHNKGDSK